MDLTHHSDGQLLLEIKQLVQADRESLARFLFYLREIERRRLFCDLKCSSVFEYLTKRLKYSEREALLRIGTMRMMRDIPEIVDCIVDGSLNLTNIGLARTLFCREEKAGRSVPTERKREILMDLQHRSTREAIEVVAQINPDMRKHKDLTFDSIADETLRQKLLLLRGRRAHRNPNMTLTDLLHELCDEALMEKSPANPKPDSQAELRRRVFKHYKGVCTNCGSNSMVEVEHIIPIAAGGENVFENLTLLCKNCNLRSAIRFYGQIKMDEHMK